MFRTRNIIGKIGFIVFALYISIAGVGVANAKLIFQDDSVGTYESETIKIGSNDAGATNTALQFGADSTGSENGNIAWNIGSNTFGIDHTVDITGGVSATGQVNFSGSAGYRMREANQTTAACATVNELILSTTDGKIYRCSATGTPGTWATTISSASDFEGVYGADAGKDLNTSNAAFTITTGTNDFIVDSNDWNVDASGNLDGNNITANGTLDANGVATIGDNGDTITLDSSDWDINATGDMTNIGAITMDGLLTGTAGATLSGATINLNNNSNFDVNIGTGTSTGTVTLGGTGAQTIAVGSGAGAKTVNVGSSLTTSTTNILSGSGAVNVNAGNNQPTNINTGGSTGLVSIGGGSGTVSIDTTSWDISSAGVGSGFTGFTSTGTVNFSGVGAFRMREVANIATAACATINELALDTTANQIYKCTATGTPGTWISTLGGNSSFEAVYTADSDKTLTTSNGAFTIAAGSGAVAVNSTNASGVSINDSVNGPINLGTGTSTGTVTVGGTGTQTISVGNGAGAKTVNLGSNNTTSTTTILSGSGGVLINDANNQPTTINSGTSTGTVSIASGSGTQTVSLGDGTTGVKTVSLGSTNTTSTTNINSGSGAVNVNASNNQPVNIATGTSTGTVTVGGTGTQTIAVGDGAGVKTVSLGSSNTTSTTTILSGSGGLNQNVNNNQPTNINTGTSTGTVTVGGTGTQTIALGNGAGAKTVRLGSTNTTSTTDINSGSGAVNVNVSNNQVTNVNTGSSTGQVNVGGGSNCVNVNSNTWDISCSGVFSGFTGLTATGAIDLSGASSFQIPQAASDPGTCTIGQQYYNTTTNTVRLCTATNTWTNVAASGNSFVFAYDTTTQTVSNTPNFQDITYDTNAQIDGWTHVAGSGNFVAGSSGTFMVNMTARIAKNGGANTTLSYRGVKNTIAVPGTFTEIAGSQAYGSAAASTGDTMSGNFIVTLASGETLKIQMTGGTNNAQILPGGNGTTLPSTQLSVWRMK